MSDEEQGNEEESVGGTIREAMAELEMGNEDLGFPDVSEFKEPTEDDQILDQTASDSEKAEPQEEGEVLVAPRSWSEDEKAAWNDYPAEAKKALLRRQSDMDRNYHSRSEEIAAREKQLSDIEQHISPLRDKMARNGHDGKTLASMYAWHEALTNADPNKRAAYAKELLTRYGVSNASIQSAANNSPQPSKVELELNQLKSQLTKQQEEAEQRKQQEYQHSVASEVNAFRNEVGESGSKKFPLIGDGEALEAPMADELRMLNQVNPDMPLREKLETAYKRALALNSDIQSQLSRGSNEAKRAAVKKAKLAGSSVTGSAHTSAPQSLPNRSLRDELLANYKEMTS